MNNNKQNIKCLVDTCLYNNCAKKVCSLDKISIGCSCCSANCKEDTICNSFKEKKSN